MKNLIFILLLLLFFYGCEKNFNNVVDPQKNQFQIIDVSSFNKFTYTPGDSLITVYLTLNTSSGISKVFCDVFSSNDEKLNSDHVEMFDDGNMADHGDAIAGDNTYSNKFPLSQSYPNGKYTIQYFITNENGTTAQVAVQNFLYENGQSNVAPVIDSVSVVPDTLVVNTTMPIQLSVKVSDQNGLADIEAVYFIVYKPDGSTNGNKFEMLDDGNSSSNGDKIAGDGIYSLIIQVDQTNAKGAYRFDFQARDRGQKLSKIISHTILIK